MSVVDPIRGSSIQADDGERELSMVRHDIRAALQSILGGVNQIDPMSLPMPAREQIERIGAAATTLARLICGDEEPEDAAPLDVGRLLALVRRRHAGEARERGLLFEIRVAENMPARVSLDLTAMVRILDNLIGNALKFTDAGSVRLSAERAPDGSIVFRVTDDGPGLRASPKERSRRAGEGLGLHIVDTLAERLGGRVQVSTRGSGGAEAEVRFPASVASGATEPPSAAAPVIDLSGLRVLLAEDNATNRMVASQMLRALNADVVACADGVEALERFNEERMDLVVVDIEMPRLSGLDVIRAIRSRRDPLAQVPIVALTAYAMREHRERIASAGANGLISKPIVSVDALGRALAAHIAPAGMRQPLEARPEQEESAAAPLIDQSVFDALAETIGPETMLELIDKVISDLKNAKATLSTGCSPVDRKSIRAASHILISVAGAIGAVRLQNSAQSLNRLAHGDATERVASEVRRCVAEIDSAVQFADGWRRTRS